MNTIITVILFIWIVLVIISCAIIVISSSIKRDSKRKFAIWWDKHICNMLDSDDERF